MYPIYVIFKIAWRWAGRSHYQRIIYMCRRKTSQTYFLYSAICNDYSTAFASINAHSSDVTWTSCRLKSLVTQHFVQQIIDANGKSKLRINGPLWGDSMGHRWCHDVIIALALHSPLVQLVHCPLGLPASSDILRQNVSYVHLADYLHESNPPVYPYRRHTAPGLQGQWNTAQPWRDLKVVSYRTWASVRRSLSVPVQSSCHRRSCAAMMGVTKILDWLLANARPPESVQCSQYWGSSYHGG